MGAEMAFKQGKKPGLLAIIIKPLASFFKHYIARSGFLDGMEGFLISILSAAAAFVKYAKLREIIRLENDKRVDSA